MRGGWGRRTRVDAEGGRGGASQDSRRLARDSWASPRCSTRGRGRGRILAPRSTVCLSVDKDNLGTRHSTLVPGYRATPQYIYELVPRHTIVVGQYVPSCPLRVRYNIQHRYRDTMFSPRPGPEDERTAPRPERGRGTAYNRARTPQGGMTMSPTALGALCPPVTTTEGLTAAEAWPRPDHRDKIVVSLSYICRKKIRYTIMRGDGS